MKRLIVAAAACLLLVSGCASSDIPADVTLPQFEEVKSGDQLATIHTNADDIKVKLFPEQAPKAVENFVKHAQEGYYDGLIFHRVISDFMIQGGDPKGNGTGGESIWKEPFEDEFSDQLYNFNGALSMANAGPDTNGSQFFIVQQHDGSTFTKDYFASIYKQLNEGKSANADFRHPNNVKEKYQEVGGTPHLDHMHTVFGQVISGMDVVNQIASAKTDEADKPMEDIKITSITISTAK